MTLQERPAGKLSEAFLYTVRNLFHSPGPPDKWSGTFYSENPFLSLLSCSYPENNAVRFWTKKNRKVPCEIFIIFLHQYSDYCRSGNDCIIAGYVIDDDYCNHDGNNGFWCSNRHYPLDDICKRI